MSTTVRAARTSRRKQRGQAAVETALVIVPLLAILCAIIDFSMAIFIRNSLVLAVREGVRYAITGQTGAGGNACQDGSIKYVVQQNSMGMLNGSAGLSKIQINYYSPATLTDVTAQPNANSAGNVVRVTVAGVPWLWMLAGIWENVDAMQGGQGTTYGGLTFGAASSDIMETPPTGIPPCR
jgi:Flp pilus assembly protein TadG